MHTGILLILFSVALTPLGDAISKDVAKQMSPLLVVFLRYLIAGLMACGVAGLRGIPIEVPKSIRLPLLAQSALVIGAMSLLIIALTRIPLALAVGGFLIAPIVAALIASLAFGERLTLGWISGAALSFLGALMILQPTTGLEAGVLISISGGGMLGTFLAVAARFRLGLHPVIALMMQCLLGAALLAPLALYQAQDFDARFALHIVALGGVTATTHFLTVAAYQRADASILAPFFYFNLIAALAIGFFWFNEVPEIWALFGLFLIVAGGLVSLVPSRDPRDVSGKSLKPSVKTS